MQQRIRSHIRLAATVIVAISWAFGAEAADQSALNAGDAIQRQFALEAAESGGVAVFSPAAIKDVPKRPDAATTRPAFSFGFERVRVAMEEVPEEVVIKASPAKGTRLTGTVRVTFVRGGREQSHAIDVRATTRPAGLARGNGRLLVRFFNQDWPVSADVDAVRVEWLGRPKYWLFSCGIVYPTRRVFLQAEEPPLGLGQATLPDGDAPATIAGGLRKVGLTDAQIKGLVSESRKQLISENDEQLLLDILQFDSRLLATAQDAKTATKMAMLQWARGNIDPLGSVLRRKLDDLTLYLVPLPAGANRVSGRIAAFDGKGECVWKGTFSVSRGHEAELLDLLTLGAIQYVNSSETTTFGLAAAERRGSPPAEMDFLAWRWTLRLVLRSRFRT